MLSAVGHPVAVNPDRELAKVAKQRGWPIERWSLEVPLRERVPMPAPRQAAVGGGAALLGAAALAGWWWWRRNGPAPAPPASRAQASRTFLAAKAARVTRAISSSSFFMRPT